LVSNARTAGYNRLVRGYLYRGVPLAAENGRLLLRNQRRLAGEVATTFQYVDSIAEVDSLGRLVFAEPYAQQQRLTDFDIGRSALFQAVRTNPNQWIVHSSFDGLDRRLLSRATPIVRNRNIDGYLIVSIDASKAFRPESLNVSLPSELADLSTEFELPEGGGRTLIQVGGGDLGLAQRILSVAPRRLIDWLYPVQLRRLDSIGQLTCRSRMQVDPFGVLRCQESIAGIGPVATKVTLQFDAALTGSPLVAGFGFLCFVAAVSVFLSVRLFGERWSILAGEKEQSSRNLVSALNNLAHDLRQVIQNLRGELRLLKAELAKARTEAPNPVEQMMLGADRLSRTVGQFELLTDNLTAGVLTQVGREYVGTKIELYMPFVVRHAVEYHRERYLSDGISINWHMDSDASGCFVLGHLAQLNRVLGNLIDNAADACANSLTKNIDVGLSARGDRVLLSVRDSGVGIEPHNVSKVFEAGFTTKERSRGQGLVSCRRIVEDLEGTIEVESTEIGKGTAILVTLPTAPAPVWFKEHIAVRPSDVLVFIDDEPEMHDMWRQRFEDRFRYVSGSLNGAAFVPTMEFVSDASELRSERRDLLVQGTHFFVDYRLKNYHVDGLSLIEEYGLQQRAVLVTNHFHDPVILRRAVEMGVPVLPKEFLWEFGFNLAIEGEHVARTSIFDR
jgi:signal transduction histidine kinase